MDASTKRGQDFLDSIPPAIFDVPALPGTDCRDGTATTRPLTELGNAMRLLDTHGDRVRFVPDAGAWLVWRDDAWHWDTDGAGVRELAARLPGDIYTEGAHHLEDGQHFAKWARLSQSSRTILATVALLADFKRVRLPLAHVDADPLKVGLDGCRQVIDLKSGAVRKATQADFVTKSLQPNHVGDADKATRWRAFLAQVFGDDAALIHWLWRWCGYLLTGSTAEQMFLFCYGLGANGKSVFAETLRHVMGDYARAIAPETLTENRRQAGGATPDLAALIGARLAMSTETEDGAALAESLVKSLTAGDAMSVRQLYAGPVQFTPAFKLLMLGNHKPIIKGNDYGIWRRVRLLPFSRQFSPEERDPHLTDKLKAEAPHILAWMVEGCAEWQKRGLADVPNAISQATDGYQEEMDLTGRWLAECCALSSIAETATGELYANYRAWSLDNGLRPASAVSLGRRLGERGISSRRSSGKTLWAGLALADGRHNDYAHAKEGY